MKHCAYGKIGILPVVFKEQAVCGSAIVPGVNERNRCRGSDFPDNINHVVGRNGHE